MSDVELPPLPEPDLISATKLLPYEERWFRTASLAEPLGYKHDRRDYFNAEAMQAYARLAVDAALEAAAVVCDAHDKDRAATGQHADAEHCAAAIRAMKSPISDSAV